MSKSMEVVIQSLEDRMDLGAKARRLMKVKRLTDAELAAEYWLAAMAGAIHHGDSLHSYNGVEVRGKSAERIRILHRFATLPHYDERPAL